MKKDNIEVQEKLKAIKECSNYVVLPDGFEWSNKPDCIYVDLVAGVPYQCLVTEQKEWDSETREYIEGSEYFSISVRGNFGQTYDGYPLNELYDLTDEEILSLKLPSDDQLKHLKELEKFVEVISNTAKQFDEYNKEHNLNRDIEWSADSAVIAEWNSSRC